MPYSKLAFDSSPIDVHDAKELMQHVYFQFIVYYLWRKERKKKPREQQRPNQMYNWSVCKYSTNKSYNYG